MNRTWDEEGKYNEGDLKEYNFWVLAVSFRQHTLGSFVILQKRQIERITDLRDDEMLELKKVMKDMESALLSADGFKPNRFNYLQLGNNKHLLHFHGIPRYREPRNFAGRLWEDKTFGKPPVWTYTEESGDLIFQIKNNLIKFFN